MSEIRPADETTPHFAPRIRPADDDGTPPPGFEPLRLAVVPGGTLLEVSRIEMVVGRHSTCDLRLPLPDVSRRHCRLLFQAGRWWVTDLRSVNGVFVNDARVTARALTAGDHLRIGGFTFIVQPTDAQAAEMERLILGNIAAALAERPREHRRAS